MLAMLDETISKTVKGYIKGLNHNTLTVMELLDMREFNKSRKENAMYSTFARGQLQQRLMQELNWRGYDYAEVDPSYTSQLCPVCGYVDKANRDGKNFECRCCGHKDDADHNASINIKERIDDKEALGICDTYRHSQKQKHRHLKELYAGRNKAWRESQAQQNPSGSTAVLPSGAMAI